MFYLFVATSLYRLFSKTIIVDLWLKINNTHLNNDLQKKKSINKIINTYVVSYNNYSIAMKRLNTFYYKQISQIVYCLHF